MRSIPAFVVIGITIFAVAVCFSASTMALLQEFPTLPPTKKVERIQIFDDDVDTRIQITEGTADTIDSGARIWDSGRALSGWIATNRIDGNKNCRVLELGAGTGIVGLTAAAAGAKSVVLTDQPDMVPLLEQNVRENKLQTNARAAPLLWGCDHEETVKTLRDEESTAAATQMPVFDIVCGSDILYSPENFPLLLETLCQVCTPSNTEVILAYPRRFTEDLFWDAASECFEIFPEEEIEPNIFLSRMRLTTW